MLLRRLLQLAFALALVVVGASATLRLAANGIGCEPWPACYGGADTAAAANATPLARALRLSHRIAASAFALVALAAVALGWRRWASGQRIAGAALLAATALLAWIGRHTPSPLPAVTLINLLGGFALLALLAYLLAARPPAAAAAAPIGALAVLAVALALQAGSGAEYDLGREVGKGLQALANQHLDVLARMELHHQEGDRSIDVEFVDLDHVGMV